MKYLSQITSILIVISVFSMQLIEAKRTVQMNILCSHMTNTEKARKVLACFKIQPGSKDEEKWNNCFTQVGIKTGASCHERYMQICKLNDTQAQKFESCARPDRYEDQAFRNCVDPI